VHADIGGGYLENEARLSDIAMGWMIAAASIVPDGLKHDGSVLKLWPDPEGPQHDEQAGGWLKKGLRTLPEDEKTHESRAAMHKSVYRRFEGDPVLLFDRIAAYRPDNLEKHCDFKQYFGPDATGNPVPEPQCVADDIEAKWEKGRLSRSVLTGGPNQTPIAEAGSGCASTTTSCQSAEDLNYFVV
jgi:hypothetical protein